MEEKSKHLPINTVPLEAELNKQVRHDAPHMIHHSADSLLRNILQGLHAR